MRVLLAAVGRLKAGPDRELFERYWDRLSVGGAQVGLGPATLIELTEGKAAGSEQRKSDEAARLGKAGNAANYTIALDERGKSVTSDAFAKLLQTQIDNGCKCTALLIGGPDGHAPELVKRADLVLSLGPMTLPHGLARIVLAEQLYRASTILAGHPYHRA